MEGIDEINKISEKFVELAQLITPLKYLQPSNIDAEKKLFMSGETEDPAFSYADPDYDVDQVRENLESIEIPESSMKAVLESKRNALLRDNELIASVGNQQRVRELSSITFGNPNQTLVEAARRLLEALKPVEIPETVTSKVIKEALEEGLKDLGIVDWGVEYSDKKLTTVTPAQKKITVCKDRLFAEGDAERLKVHEVGVHAVRGANGYEQAIKLFGLGFPGYMATEEGLASYFEEISGNSNPNVIRNYAGRVLAVDSVIRNFCFRETYDLLKTYDFSDEDSWNLSFRAHRGGGFIKDHIYLEGFLKIKQYVANGGDLKLLFVGKIGLEDIPLVEELLQQGVIKPAKYLPSFIQ